MLLLLHLIDNLLAYVAILFVAGVSKLSKSRGADARTGDSVSHDSGIESATAKFYFSRLVFTLV